MPAHRRWWITFFVLLLVAVGLRLGGYHQELVGPDDWGMSIELVVARNHSLLGLSKTLGLPIFGYWDQQPILYATHPHLSYLLLAALIAICGNPVITWRTYHLVLSIGVALNTSWLASRRLSPAHALPALAILLFAPVFIHLGRTGATEMPFLFFLTLYWVAEEKAERSTTAKWWLIAGALLGLAQACDMYGLLLVPILLAKSWRGGPKLQYFLLALVPVAIQALLLLHVSLLAGTESSISQGAARGLSFAAYWISPNYYWTTLQKLALGFAILPIFAAPWGCYLLKRRGVRLAWLFEPAGFAVLHFFFCSFWMAHHDFFILFFGPLLALTGSEAWLRGRKSVLLILYLIGLAICLPRLYGEDRPQYPEFGRQTRKLSSDEDLFIGVPSVLGYYIARPAMIPYNYFRQSRDAQTSARIIRQLATTQRYRRIILFSSFLYEDSQGSEDYSKALDGLPWRHVYSESDHSWEVWRREN